MSVTSRAAFHRRWFAPPPGSPWPSQRTRAITTWSAASTPSCWTWSGPPPKLSTSPLRPPSHEVPSQRAHLQGPVGCRPVCSGVFLAGPLAIDGILCLHARPAHSLAGSRGVARYRQTDRGGCRGCQRLVVFSKPAHRGSTTQEPPAHGGEEFRRAAGSCRAGRQIREHRDAGPPDVAGAGCRHIRGLAGHAAVCVARAGASTVRLRYAYATAYIWYDPRFIGTASVAALSLVGDGGGGVRSPGLPHFCVERPHANSGPF